MPPTPARIAAIVPGLLMGLAAPATAQTHDASLRDPVPSSGLMAKLHARPAVGSPVQNQTFARHAEFYLDLTLHNTTEQPLAIPTSGHQGQPSMHAIVLRMVDPGGVERVLNLGAATAEPGGAPSVLQPDRKTHRVFDLIEATQTQHWPWWEGVGFPPGTYRVRLEFSPPPGPGTWSGTVHTNEIVFQIVEGGVYPTYAPEGRKEVLHRANNGQPTHVAWLDARGRCTVERLYRAAGSNGKSHLLAEIVHATPAAFGGWKIAYESIDFGGGSSTSRQTVEPDGHRPTAHVRTWSPAWQDGAEQNFAFDLIDGVRHGTYTAWAKGRRTVGDYDRGQRTGVWITTMHEVPIVAQHYDQDERHGSRMEWHRDGARHQRMNYHRGELDGVLEAWTASGTRTRLEHWQHGEKHGTFATWSRQGTPQTLHQYDRDQPSGTWRQYDPAGALLTEGTYRNGHPWSGTFYHRDQSAAQRGATITEFENGRLQASRKLTRSNTQLPRPRPPAPQRQQRSPTRHGPSRRPPQHRAR